jgi:hypothetical protein
MNAEVYKIGVEYKFSALALNFYNITYSWILKGKEAA